MLWILGLKAINWNKVAEKLMKDAAFAVEMRDRARTTGAKDDVIHNQIVASMLVSIAQAIYAGIE